MGRTPGAMALAQWYDARLDLISQRINMICARGTVKGENDHWIVEYVATKPEFRKKGLCHRSLLEILQRGRQRGFKRAQVTPYVENAASIKAYEKIGFRGTQSYLN